jgi:hypothetical protein
MQIGIIIDPTKHARANFIWWEGPFKLILLPGKNEVLIAIPIANAKLQKFARYTFDSNKKRIITKNALGFLEEYSSWAKFEEGKQKALFWKR